MYYERGQNESEEAAQEFELNKKMAEFSSLSIEAQDVGGLEQIISQLEDELSRLKIKITDSDFNEDNLLDMNEKIKLLESNIPILKNRAEVLRKIKSQIDQANKN